MLSCKLLLILTELNSLSDVIITLSSAIKKANAPAFLSIAIPHLFKEGLEYTEFFEVLPKIKKVYYYEDQNSLLELAKNSKCTYFLKIKGVYQFFYNWQFNIILRYKKIKTDNVLLTSYIMPPTANYHAQCYLPALLNINKNTYEIIRGIALVNCKMPPPTMVVNPDMYMGPLSFLLEVDITDDILSLAAYLARYHTFVLDVPVFSPVKISKNFFVFPTDLPINTTLRTLFEKQIGVSNTNLLNIEKSKHGLFFGLDSYKLKKIYAVKEQIKHKFLLKKNNNVSVLWVTAFVDLPNQQHASYYYMIYYNFLSNLSNQPLITFTKSIHQHYIKSLHANSLPYPTRIESPIHPKQICQTDCTSLSKEKSLLLLAASKRQSSFSHYLWGDIDILRYPISWKNQPNFQSLLDDTIHVSIVKNEIDTSFFVVPKNLLSLFANATLDYVAYCSSLSVPFNEKEMMHKIIEKYPTWFTLHTFSHKKRMAYLGFPLKCLREKDKAIIKNSTIMNY